MWGYWLRRVAVVIGIALVLIAALLLGLVAALALASLDFWLRQQ